jgi:hypothetical protein
MAIGGEKIADAGLAHSGRLRWAARVSGVSGVKRLDSPMLHSLRQADEFPKLIQRITE